MAAIFGILYIAVAVAMIVGNWKLYTKGDMPGWGSIIPYFNVYLIYKKADIEGWKVLLMLVPVVSFYALYLYIASIHRMYTKEDGTKMNKWIFGIFFAFTIPYYGLSKEYVFKGMPQV